MNFSAAHSLTVSELSNRLKGLVEASFGTVCVEGEVSGLKRHSSGHVYFSLKDEGAVLASVMWRGTAASQVHILEEGAHVLAHGRLTTYGMQSKYQLVVSKVEVAGMGALMQRFEALKKKLSAEGLFDASRKKQIPKFPNRIGIITSETGAVIEDMKHRIEARFPTHVVFHPVAVQGAGAAEQVAAALKVMEGLSEERRPDVILVARGGGSLEDLWAFNEEVLVRAVAACSIPVVSGVGHEPDVTLCDYAADLRAPTPTAAAELVTPVRTEILAELSQRHFRMAGVLRGMVNLWRSRVQGVARGLPEPSLILAQQRFRLEDRRERLGYSAKVSASSCFDKFLNKKQRLNLDLLKLNVKNKGRLLVQNRKLLESFSPMGVLERGYVLVKSKEGEVLKRSKGVEKGESVRLVFVDGERCAELVD